MNRSIIITLVSLFSLNLFAANGAPYSARHLAKIEQAIAEQCYLRGEFAQVSSVVEEVRIDQGITDYNFETTFTHRNRIDQGVFDDYSIEVISHYSDMYDHTDRDWGFYSVSSVRCMML